MLNPATANPTLAFVVMSNVDRQAAEPEHFRSRFERRKPCGLSTPSRAKHTPVHETVHESVNAGVMPAI
jgi:hypothetical protein